jgi:hypothetical protein
VGSSGVRAYIAQVDRLLAAGQGLFPHGGPGVEVRNAGEGGVPAAPPGPSGMSFGSGGAAQDYRGSWAQVTRLDDDANTTAGAGDANGQDGRSGATGVRQSAQSAAAAIAPATGSPAGVKVLVSTMDARMADMQHQIDTTKTQNQPLATRFQQLAAGYRSLDTAYVPPKPPPTVPAGTECWIGTKDGDVQKLCPSNTDTVTYVDDDGNYVAKTLPGGEITIMHRPGPMDGDPPSVGSPTQVRTDQSAGPPQQSGRTPTPVFSSPRKPGRTARFASPSGRR